MYWENLQYDHPESERVGLIEVNSRCKIQCIRQEQAYPIILHDHRHEE